MKKKDLLKEIRNTVRTKLMNEGESPTHKKHVEAPSDGLYSRVQTLLDNELYNHAEVMRRLGWDGDDDTNRSKFRKKLHKEKNDDGGVYEFTTEELEKIISIIENPTKKS